MQLLDYYKKFNKTSSQRKAIEYLQTWLAKWRKPQYLIFSQKYRNMAFKPDAPVDLWNTFVYFEEEPHQVAAIEYIETILREYAKGVVLFAFDGFWRTPETPPKSQLENRFWPQTESRFISRRHNCCNPYSVVMWLRYNGVPIQHPDDFVAEFDKRGVGSTDQQIMTRLIRDTYGIQTIHKTNGTFSQLDQLIEQRVGAPLGLLHRGSTWNPTGGHIIFVFGKEGNNYVCHDPYGSVLDGYTSDVYNGRNVQYPRSVLQARWDVPGPANGWIRTFS